MAKRKEEKTDSCAQVASQILLKVVSKNGTSSNDNILLSPLCLHAVLSMTAAGATGHTLKQMLNFLGVRDIYELESKFSDMAAVFETMNNSDGPKLSFVSGIWIADTHEGQIRDYYKDIITRVYKTEARIVDFKRKEEVVREANKWAKSASKGLIKEVLKTKHLNDKTTVLFANALYFKGTWKDNFKEELTIDKDFYLLNGEKVSTPFMTGCEKYLYGSFEGYQLARIPYGIEEYKKDYAMYIILPNENNGLPNLLEQVHADPKFFTQRFRWRSETLKEFFIPKFKFSYTTPGNLVIESMKEMGLTLPFDVDCGEITEIVKPRGPFFINMILQKAFVDVNEKGTEAAAVTFESDDDMGFSLYEPPPQRFVADHPFLFMIREDVSKMLLFTGAVLNPLSSSNDADL